MSKLNFKLPNNIFNSHYITPINHKESEFKIYITSDFDMFKTMNQNRDLKPNHLSRIVTNIKEVGMLCQPIIVNEYMEVIDGQHRLAAAKLLKAPIYYIIAEGYNLHTVKSLNIVSKIWTPLDHLKSFAADGIKDYVLLLDFMERHEVFNVSTCVLLCSQNGSAQRSLSSRGSKNSIFKKGLYKIGDLKKGETYAMRLKQIKPFFIKYKELKFARVIVGLFIDKPKEFKFAEFINKLKLQPTKLIPCSTGEQYKDLIEKIYNYRRKNKVNLRF